MEKLVGREVEIRELNRCLNSARSEFVILFGRRRIGKTFLVNAFLQGKKAFAFVGSHKAKKTRQLSLFAQALQTYGNLSSALVLRDWFQAFDTLRKVLSSRRGPGKKLIFLDEMPWIDRSRSEFVSALEDFWNGWAAQRDDIMLLATGSATSWMVNNLLKNQGGLYNRVTCKIHLRPFTLRECEQYLIGHHCLWDRYTITQCYMYLGGVPYYLSLLDFERSLYENVYQFFFAPHARLETEFNDLYAVLFNDADRYIQIVRLLAQHRNGMTRNEMVEQLGGGGGLTKILDNLQRSDFITSYQHFGHSKRDAIFRLTDFYTMFYLRFVEGVGMKTNPLYWHLMQNKQSVKVWQGLTFELVALMHVEQIKKSLGISGMLTDESAWRSLQEHDVGDGRTRKAQIDLVIDRADRMVHLCEMKFSQEPFEIDKEYEQTLRDKASVFRIETKTRKALLTTFVTTYGVKQNRYAGIVFSQVVMDELFA